MPLLPFGDFEPDISDYLGVRSQNVENVVPRSDGYGPFPDFVALTQSLPGTCRGGFYARKTDGSIAVFAGTSTDLYMLNNATFAWTKVSLGGGPYAALSSTAQWQFVQFNNLVIAVQANVVPQSFDLTSSTLFANLAGSPPQAAYVAVVNFFVMLAGLLSLPYRLQWSGLGNATQWTAGVNQSDFQDFADGGIVVGVAGGEYGFVFQNTTFRQLTYAPGSAYIFQITRVSEDKGLYAPYALVRGGDRVFFPSTQGFMKLEPGQPLPIPIGKEKIDRYFFTNIDAANPQLIIGAPDPQSTRVLFAFKSLAGQAGLFDTILIYDYALDRWSLVVAFFGEYLTTLAKPGITLENLDQVAPGGIAITSSAASPVSNGAGGNWTRLLVSTQNLPAMPTPRDGAPVPTKLAVGQIIDIFGVTTATELNAEGIKINLVPDTSHIDVNVTWVHNGTGGTIAGPLDAMTASLDSYPNSSTAGAAMVNSAHAFGFFNGPNLQAILESSEQGDIGKRIQVNGFRPVTDAPGCFGAVSKRENLQATRVYAQENPINARGLVPARVSTRYARGKIRIPYGATWTFALGVEPDVRDLGTGR